MKDRTVPTKILLWRPRCRLAEMTMFMPKRAAARSKPIKVISTGAPGSSSGSVPLLLLVLMRMLCMLRSRKFGAKSVACMIICIPAFNNYLFLCKLL